jgi:E3 ubiquitin-protein ligase HECTD4
MLVANGDLRKEARGALARIFVACGAQQTTEGEGEGDGEGDGDGDGNGEGNGEGEGEGEAPPGEEVAVAVRESAETDGAAGASKRLAPRADAVTADEVLAARVLTVDATAVTPAMVVRALLATTGQTSKEQVESVFGKFGDHGYLGADGLAAFVLWRSKEDVFGVLYAFVQLGFDLAFDEYKYLWFGSAQRALCERPFSLGMFERLAAFGNSLSQALHVPALRMDAADVFLRAADLSQERFAALQNVPLVQLRLCFVVLQILNERLAELLPLADLREGDVHMGMRSLVHRCRGLMFYGAKMAWFNGTINDTAHRTDPSGPEIVLDALETVGRGEKEVELARTQFMQAAHQVSELDPSLMRVKLASGGDPLFPLNVRLEGVHGLSGSFRDFMLRMAHEVQSHVLPLVMECPSGAFGVNKGKYILRPGTPTFPVAQMLEFVGVLFGLALRSDVPLPLDLLPCFWKSLVGEELDSSDITDADFLTAKRLHALETMKSAEAFAEFIQAEGPLTFVATALDGRRVNLPLDGDASFSDNVPVTWANREQYIKAVRELRLKELRCEPHLEAVRRGLARVVPLSLLSCMTWQDMELRTCGLPDVDLAFLKAHTHYNVGLSETDPHIVFFWQALEGFSKEDLRKFIKFACNQERIPTSCPCQDGSGSHVPPYPMKIAAPDGSGPADARFIRAETCMFMLKLPQYSSQEIMNERLSYAIHCREDPLIG